MQERTGLASPLEADELNCRVVMEMIYRPRSTPLLRLAKRQRIATISGVEMFPAQGAARNTSIWTGKRAPEAAMRKAVLTALQIEERTLCSQGLRNDNRTMIEPDFQTFCTLAKQGNLVPVYETFTADLLTPVGAYLRLARHSRYACLLESVEGGEKIARYTFVGANPVEVFRYVNGACVLEGESRVSWVQENPLDFLRNRLERYKPVRVPDLPPLTAGAIGYFAYDMVRLFERLPDDTRNDLKMDDAVMMFYLGLVVFDHVRRSVTIVRNVFTEGEGSLRTKYHAADTSRFARRASNWPRRWTRRPRGRSRGKRGCGPLRVTSNFTHRQYLAAVRKVQGVHSRRRYFPGSYSASAFRPRLRPIPSPSTARCGW